LRASIESGVGSECLAKKILLMFVLGGQLAKNLVNHVTGVGVSPACFPGRDMTVKNAGSPDAQTAEAIEIVLHSFDVAFSGG
jgi:hypothetical protein